jgi:hypothetical protein
MTTSITRRKFVAAIASLAVVVTPAVALAPASASPKAVKTTAQKDPYRRGPVTVARLKSPQKTDKSSWSGNQA